MVFKKIYIVLGILGLYLISTGVSWAVFSYLTSEPEIQLDQGDIKTSRSRINPNLPKTEICPINGKKFSKDERTIWEERRPITAIIENSEEARPQSGLSRADVVYEAVAEGGVTRFLAVFYCGAAAEDVKIAPLRSARIYFVNWAAGYGKSPIFLHIGGANNFCNTCPGGVKLRGQVAREVDAYAALDKLGWRAGQYGNDFDGGYNIGYPVIVRNQYRLTQEPAKWEHSVEVSLDLAYQEAKKRNFEFKDKDNVSWNQNFKEWRFSEGKASPSSQASDISFSFWNNKPDYDIEWKYDSSANVYKRFNGGKAHIDWEFDKPQITASNLVIMFVKEKGPVDSEVHMFYENIGQGEALIFQNGEKIEATWKKVSQLDREVFYDKNGKEISFVEGNIWIEAVPKGNKIGIN